VRLAVCGGREFGRTDEERQCVYLWIEKTLGDEEEKIIIQGGAPGADEVAVDWAIINGVKYLTYDADWKKYKRAAGPIRNQRIIDEGKPDLLLAFPGNKGTADMIRRAVAANIPVTMVTF
jgi:hypothetical protein